MRMHVFSELIHERMAEKGLGGKDVTIITEGGERHYPGDVYFCTECGEFHITLTKHQTIRDLGVQHSD